MHEAEYDDCANGEEGDAHETRYRRQSQALNFRTRLESTIGVAGPQRPCAAGIRRGEGDDLGIDQLRIDPARSYPLSRSEVLSSGHGWRCIFIGRVDERVVAARQQVTIGVRQHDRGHTALE